MIPASIRWLGVLFLGFFPFYFKKKKEDRMQVKAFVYEVCGAFISQGIYIAGLCINPSENEISKNKTGVKVLGGLEGEKITTSVNHHG